MDELNKDDVATPEAPDADVPVEPPKPEEEPAG